jgi:hypothetical protein
VDKVVYDLDGVLAVAPRPCVKAWRFMDACEREKRRRYLLNHYAKAGRLYSPTHAFYVLTARRNHPLIKRGTITWLRTHFPDAYVGVFFLPWHRTLRNVVDFKSSKLLKIGATHFVEDNEKVLKGVAKKIHPRNPEMTFWLYSRRKFCRYNLKLKSFERGVDHLPLGSDHFKLRGPNCFT